MKIPLLTEGESKVYSSLVELGESSVGDIIKKSGVSHSKIYDILKRLSEKGLVSSLNKNGRQHFSASEPSRLREILSEEFAKIKSFENDLDKIIGNLNSRKKKFSSKPIMASFEGIKGMKTALEMILGGLKKGDEVLIMGSPKKLSEVAGGYIADWQKRRVKNKIKCRIIIDSDSSSWNYSWWDKSKKEGLTLSKRRKSFSPAYLVISENAVLTMNVSEVVLSFIVEHSEVAKSYIEFFNEAWKS